MPVQHRQQHVETITLKTERDATRIADRRLIDQRLHFDQHWPRTLPRDGNDATRYRRAVARQKQRRRIVDLLEAAIGHREHAQLIDCAKAVLDRADDAETRTRIVLEVQHGIDHVLENTRSEEHTSELQSLTRKPLA